MKVEIIESVDQPYILVDALSLLKFHFLLDLKYDKEFTVFMHATRNKSEYYLFDFFIPNQVNTPVHTELDGEDLVQLMSEGADITKLRGHGHSHVEMGVTPSGTDVKEIHSRAELAGFNAAFIINKKYEMFGHIADMDAGIYYKDVDIFVKYPFADDEFESQILKGVKKLKSLDEIRTLMTMTEWEFYVQEYALEDAEKKELIEAIRLKFSSPVSTTYGSTYGKANQTEWQKNKEKLENKYNTGKSIELKLPKTENLFEDDDYMYDESAFTDVDPSNKVLTDEEFFDYLCEKSYGDMTDEEWNWYESYIALDDAVEY